MKKLDITPEVIAKAKEIASLWRMEIYEGCWLWIAIESDAHPDELLIFNPEKTFIDNVALRFSNGCYYIDWFPVPSISDCLEKLLELGYESMNLQRRSFRDSWMINIWDKESHVLEADTIKRWRNKGKALHEVLLFVLLEALKEVEE